MTAFRVPLGEHSAEHGTLREERSRNAGTPTAPAFAEPRLPREITDAARKLLASALAVKIAADLADTEVARQAAREVIALLDAIDAARQLPLPPDP